jgi:hypothetical protein
MCNSCACVYVVVAIFRCLARGCVAACRFECVLSAVDVHTPANHSKAVPLHIKACCDIVCLVFVRSWGKLSWAGFEGVEAVLADIRRFNNMGHALLHNIRQVRQLCCESQQ